MGIHSGPVSVVVDVNGRENVAGADIINGGAPELKTGTRN
jgi:hypothetical protein